MKAITLTPLLLILISCAARAAEFIEVTDTAGLVSEPTWKYGGPTLADLNADGRLDLVLGNHHEVPAQLFLSTGPDRFAESEPVMKHDVHGIAAGDYDRDGRVDLVVSMGGGNGTNPQPPRLLRNTGSGFEDRTEAAGIAQLGARGRSVRWLDMDLDGDLDLLQINARQIPGEAGPRNILFENIGDGRFSYRESPLFEQVEAERVLVTDLNGDRVPDLVTFTPLMVLTGRTDFQFTDSSNNWLVSLSDNQREHAMAAAEADIDNDGDMDLYVARGKTYYEMADNSLDFDPATGRMDLRDEGSASEDAIEFEAGDEVVLSDFWHWHRGVDLTLPVYLGAKMEPRPTPSSPMTVAAADARGIPESLKASGWYLGHLGGNRWRLAWKLDGDLAWGIRASVSGVAAVHPLWTPNERGVHDLLLINEGDHYSDSSALLPPVAADNNWGVITGDFDNDGRQDLFLYRFGRLRGRVEDVLITNQSVPDGIAFQARTDHGANNVAAGGHGDMGAPLDYDGDGWLDILSGSDNPGRWHLYRNTSGDSETPNHWLIVKVGHSPGGVDPLGAEARLESAAGTQLLRVGSRGAVHSQSLDPDLHFGLGAQQQASRIRIRWRDGTEQVIGPARAGRAHVVGQVAGIVARAE